MTDPIIQRAQEREAQHRKELADLLGEQYATHPAVTPQLALLLERAYSLRRAYLDSGRGREAHGAARVIQLMWHTILHQQKPLPREQFLPTMHGGFDLDAHS